MRHITIAIMISMAFGSPLLAQNTIDGILVEIEKNNTTLSALRERAKANTLGNKTGIYLTNPEIEFNYLWGMI